ncbi:MAG: hypothetical protein AAF702_48755 [Chloroflexota bacterium]
MRIEEGILYPLFDHLRRSDVPLGVGDYLLALELLREGYGVENLEQIKQTCRLVWTKSHADQAIFDQAFEQLIRPAILAYRPRRTTKPSGATEPQVDHDTRPASHLTEGTQSNLAVNRSSQEPLQMGTLPLNPRRGSSIAESGPEPYGIYQFTPRPSIGLREMAGIWRHLREMRREGRLVELDVDATIQEISRNGFVLAPKLRARRRNQVQMLILLDRSPTMTAFSPLVNTLLDSIRRSGLLGETSICYFRNSPRQYLSLHPGMVDHQPIEAVLAEKATGRSVLIISDAGAGQGAYRKSLVEEVSRFLWTLHDYTYLSAWLNPLPQDRWQSTSAEEIAQLVPMFPIERDGLVDAVNVLRGQPHKGGPHG